MLDVIQSLDRLNIDSFVELSGYYISLMSVDL
jgi:hypothetical protein